MKKKIRLSIIVFLGVFLFLMGGMVTVQAAQYYCVMDEYGPGYWKDVSLTDDSWNVWNGEIGRAHV